jgi:dsDNA-binding SOS-regulon protein
MRVETLADVMEWTRSVHKKLAEAIDQGVVDSSDERLHMLADYLSEHERRLAHVLEQAEEDAQQSVLNTWVYEFFRNVVVKHHDEFDFHNKDADHVLSEVLQVHEEIIGVYRDLAARADRDATRELLENLCGLEEHETMRTARDAGMLRDL